jgi:hypothetical protein
LNGIFQGDQRRRCAVHLRAAHQQLATNESCFLPFTVALCRKALPHFVTMPVLGLLMRNMYATLRLVACPYSASICDQRHMHLRTASKRHHPASLQLETACSQRAMLLRFPTVFYFY